MPITVTAPRGELTPEGEAQILPRLTTALVNASGAEGNQFFTSIVGGTVHLLEPKDIYGGGEPRPIVMVELKLPDIGLNSEDTRAAFIEAATQIVDELTVSGHSSNDTWINILNAPSGGWGIGGVSFTAERIVSAAQPPAVSV
ncbi:MAG: hypothetical protein ABJA94_02435 [Rhodoglobus sp.]